MSTTIRVHTLRLAHEALGEMAERLIRCNVDNCEIDHGNDRRQEFLAARDEIDVLLREFEVDVDAAAEKPGASA